MTKLNSFIPFLSLAISIALLGANWHLLQKVHDSQNAQEAAADAWRQEADKIIRQPHQAVTATPSEPAKALSLPEMTAELVKRRAKLDEDLRLSISAVAKADDEMEQRKVSSGQRRESTATLDTFRQNNPVEDFLPEPKKPITKDKR